MADTQRMDFDTMKAQASRVGAEALNVSSGTDAGWGGTARKAPKNELEKQFNAQMGYYATLFHESRGNLNAALEKLFAGMKEAMRTFTQTEQSITVAVQREDGALPTETTAAALGDQLDEDAKAEHESRMRYEQMEDTHLKGRSQAQFDALAKKAETK